MVDAYIRNGRIKEEKTMADHLMHRTRFSYDGQGNTSRTCLECNVPLETIWRICPRCATPFDGTSIGAALEARILCSDCTQRMMGERREEERRRVKRVR